ncbi:MAG TPA: hypothetical protein VGQ83_04825 [Polyangia bacterium]
MSEDGAPDSGAVDAGRHYEPGPVIRRFTASPRALPDGMTATGVDWEGVACTSPTCSCSIAPRLGQGFPWRTLRTTTYQPADVSPVDPGMHYRFY